MTIDWTQPHAARFKAAMDEDFGTPEAVAVLFELAGEVNRSQSAQAAGLLKALGGCLGLLQGDPQAFLQRRHRVFVDAREVVGVKAFAQESVVLQPEKIQEFIEARNSARAAKNFAEADRIRKELLEQGIVLKDSPTGTTWEAAA